MTPDGAPIPHQTLHGSARKIRRYYFRCSCGFLRGRNARFPCSCGAPPSSWSTVEVLDYRRAQRKYARFLMKRGYCVCDCGGIRYVTAPCPCGG